MGKQSTKPSGVTWAEIASALKREGISVSRATVRKYQQMGLIPAPRPMGRAGRGPGVDWVWPKERAQTVIAKIRELRAEKRGAKRLRRISQREVLERMYWLLDEAGKKVVPRGGIAWLTFFVPEGPGSPKDSLGAQMIACGLDHLDDRLEKRGILLLVFAPEPEPQTEEGEPSSAER